MNIVERIFRDADRQAVALVSEGEEVTYGRLIEMADEAARRIAGSPAERVGLDCPNGIAHVVHWPWPLFVRGNAWCHWPVNCRRGSANE